MILPKHIVRKFIGTRAFYRQVLLLLIPVMIQNMVTNMVNLLDNLMVGAVGTVPMSAVAIINQLVFVFTLCIYGGLSGPSIFATQFVGARDHTGLRNCFRTKLWVCAIIILFSLATFLIFPNQLINLFLKSKATDPQDIVDTLHFARTYLFIILVGLPPFSLSMAYATSLREMGETRMPMIASVAALVVNLLFNYLLIFGKFGFPCMGVAGAALATTMSRFVELAIIMSYTHLNKGTFVFVDKAYRSVHVPLSLLRSIGKKGIPLWLNELLWAAGISAVVQCYSLRGLHVVAAFNITANAVNLFNCAFYSMGSAVSVIIGQELGAKHMKTVKDTAWQLATISLAISLIVGTTLFILAPYIPKLYNTEDDVKAIASSMMRIFCMIAPPLALTHSSYFTIRAGGRSVITFLLDSGFTWVCMFGASWYIGHYTEMSILPFFFISRSMEILKAVIALALLKSGVWIRNFVS